MTRRYFDLPLSGYSFAEFASRRGWVAITLDHPGVGDSDRPRDGWQLTVERIARTNACAVAEAMSWLSSEFGLEAHQALGVGHSMGAHVLIHHQAASPQFDRIAVLGWSGAGLLDSIPAQVREAHDPSLPVRDNVALYARRLFHEPLPNMRGRDGGVGLVGHPVGEDVKAALGVARSPLLALAATSAIVPGSAAHALEAIDVPVFAAVGENDMAARDLELRDRFPRAPLTTLFQLAEAGHNHNVAPTRTALWSALLDWAECA